MKISNGDIYQVGSHIIGCGDSTDRFFVNKVVDGKIIRAVIVDPPYGVAYVEKKKIVRSSVLKMPRQLSVTRYRQSTSMCNLQRNGLSASSHIWIDTIRSISLTQTRCFLHCVLACIWQGFISVRCSSGLRISQSWG